jgi:hypothetical protein
MREDKTNVEILRSVIRALEHSAHQRLVDRLRDLLKENGNVQGAA